MSYIEREAAVNALAKIINDYDMPKDWRNGMSAAMSALFRIPAADVRPAVRARWEDETGYIFSNLAQRVYCPACKSYAYFYPITAKNFCPNCDDPLYGYSSFHLCRKCFDKKFPWLIDVEVGKRCMTN